MRHFYRYYEKSSIVITKRESYFGADFRGTSSAKGVQKFFLFGSTFLIFDFLLVLMSLFFFLFVFFIRYKFSIFSSLMFSDSPQLK